MFRKDVIFRVRGSLPAVPAWQLRISDPLPAVLTVSIGCSAVYSPSSASNAGETFTELLEALRAQNPNQQDPVRIPNPTPLLYSPPRREFRQGPLGLYPNKPGQIP